MQNGEGLIWKIEKMSETAVSAFSPPDISSIDEIFFPGGWAKMSIPVSSMSSGFTVEPKGRSAAAEHLREDLLELRVHGVERLREELLRLAVHLRDRPLEIGQRLVEVRLLRRIEGVPLLGFVVLAHGIEVHAPHPLEELRELVHPPARLFVRRRTEMVIADDARQL